MVILVLILYFLAALSIVSGLLILAKISTILLKHLSGN